MVPRGVSIGLLVFVLIAIIAYTITMLILASNKSGIFSPYVPPAPPASQNGFYPLGTITPLCTQQIIDRNKIICASYYGGYEGMTAGQITPTPGATGWSGLCSPDNWPTSQTPCPAPSSLSDVASNQNPDTANLRVLSLPSG